MITTSFLTLPSQLHLQTPSFSLACFCFLNGLFWWAKVLNFNAKLFSIFFDGQCFFMSILRSPFADQWSWRQSVLLRNHHLAFYTELLSTPPHSVRQRPQLTVDSSALMWLTGKIPPSCSTIVLGNQGSYLHGVVLSFLVCSVGLFSFNPWAHVTLA